MGKPGLRMATSIIILSYSLTSFVSDRKNEWKSSVFRPFIALRADPHKYKHCRERHSLTFRPRGRHSNTGLNNSAPLPTNPMPEVKESLKPTASLSPSQAPRPPEKYRLIYFWLPYYRETEDKFGSISNRIWILKTQKT